MKRRKGRRLFSLLLIAAMVLSLSGIIAFAAEVNTQAEDEVSEETEETEEQGLSFKSSKVSKTTDDAPFTNQLSGVVGKVTYTSSKKSVATVDQKGKVTIVGTGTATITATDDGNGTDEAGTASFTLTVSKPTGKKTASVSAAADEDSEESEDTDKDDEETAKSEDGDEEDSGTAGEADSEAAAEEDSVITVGEDGDSAAEEAGEAEDEEAGGAAAEEAGEAEDEEDGDSAAEEGSEAEDEEDGETADEEDAEDAAEEDSEAEDEEDGEDAAEADSVITVDEDGEDAAEEAGEAEDEEDGEAVDEEDGYAEADDAEADDAEDGDEEDGDAADSLTMEEPLLAEMTGMTVSYYSVAASDKDEQDLSFSAGNTVNKDVGSAPFINPLNGAVGDVEYSSSDDSVVSVDGNGIVTINGAGNAIITAEVSETADYKEGTASYLAVISEESEEGSESTADSQHKDDTMNIRVALAWEGDTESMRPESVEIALLADGSEKYTTSLTESGGWNHTWTDLPVYSENNVKIEYTVKEKVVPSGYTAGYGDWFDEENDTYSIVITDTWGVESDTSGVDGPKTSDVNFWVLYLYLAVLASSSIMLFSLCRRAPRR